MEADIEVGWANRLIQLFGAGCKLSFEEGCPSRAMLIKAEIDKELLPSVEKSPEFNDDVWPRLIHALRHGFADAALQFGMDSLVIDDVSGRKGTTETATRYTNVTGLPRLINALKAIPVVTDHLEPQPLRLLPWAGRKMTQRQRAESRASGEKPRTT